MTPAKRLELRRKTQTNRRQAKHRARQAEKGLMQLQVRISRYAHAKAIQASIIKKVTLTRLYELAILESDLLNLPRPHLEVCSGELIGSKAINPWVTSKAYQHFFGEIVNHYPKSRLAISAIVHDYSVKVIGE